MQAEPTLRAYDVMEREAVYLLTDPKRHPAIWSVGDLGREIEARDPDAVIRPLITSGLIHRTTDGFVFATPAAFRMVSLVGHVV
jgi:hypothetical protein